MLGKLPVLRKCYKCHVTERWQGRRISVGPRLCVSRYWSILVSSCHSIPICCLLWSCNLMFHQYGFLFLRDLMFFKRCYCRCTTENMDLQIPGARYPAWATIYFAGRQIFMGLPCGTCFIFPFWRLEMLRWLLDCCKIYVPLE